MRWLVVVRGCVDDQETFHALYDVIFYFLQSDTIVSICSISVLRQRPGHCQTMQSLAPDAKVFQDSKINP